MKKICTLALVAMAITISATAQEKGAAVKKTARSARIEKIKAAKKEHHGEPKAVKPAADKKADATK